MEFKISKSALLKELGFVQGIVERKNTIPVLSNLLIESVGNNAVRLVGTDLDVTLRCEVEAEMVTPGSMCVQARKVFEISRLLPDAPVLFRKEANDWATIECERSNFRVAGVPRESFPEIPKFETTQINLPAESFKTFIDRTIFAITQEESRYTLSGAKFILNSTGARMVTTDGHRLAFIESKDVGQAALKSGVDVLIPRKTLAEIAKLTTGYEGEINFGADENHVYFGIGPRLLVSRLLSGQFPNYEMVMPKDNKHSVVFDSGALVQAIRRVAVMADDRSRAIRFHLTASRLDISSQTAEEGEARESLIADYAGDEIDIGFNAQYLQDFLNVLGGGGVRFEFKDSNSQAQLRPVEGGEYDYRYVIMPMRL
ncbi:MAG: DNA polymerase III subunit beta [Pyrinomonadaceae bacterium]